MNGTDAPLEQTHHGDEKKSIEDQFETRRGTIVSIEHGIGLNASGHKDQLARQYNIFHLAGLALTIDNAWIALGGSISISIRQLSLSPRLEYH